MWTKIFVLFLVLGIVASIPLENLSERKCVVGKSYNDGCNQCHCTGSGITACTLMACQRYNPETNTYELAKILPPPEDYWVS